MNIFLQIHAYLLNNVLGLSVLSRGGAKRFNTKQFPVSYHKAYEKYKDSNELWFRLDVPKSYKLTRRDDNNIDGLIHDDDKPFRRGEGFYNRTEEKIYALLRKVWPQEFDFGHDNIDEDGIIFQVSISLSGKINNQYDLVKAAWNRN